MIGRLHGLRHLRQRCWHRAHKLALRATLATIPALRLVHMFRDAGITSAPLAQPFHPGSVIDQLELQRLLCLGVIREPRPCRYFLDEQVLSDVAA